MIEEQCGDRFLKIRTSGRDATGSDQYKYPYEPTPYSVLERLGNSGEIRKQNTLLDYGCGKGRVGFFLSYQTGCHSIGIEYNERFYQAALKNKEVSAVGRKTDFVLKDASCWKVPSEVDRCFFFNPFCLEILKKVMARILESYYEAPREIRLYFYYASEEYIRYLSGLDQLEKEESISCRDLFSGDNEREQIHIFTVGRMI